MILINKKNFSKRNDEEFKSYETNQDLVTNNPDEETSAFENEIIIDSSYNNSADSHTSTNTIRDNNNFVQMDEVDECLKIIEEELKSLNDLIEDPSIDNLNNTLETFSEDFSHTSEIVDYINNNLNMEGFRELFATWGGSNGDALFQSYWNMLEGEIRINENDSFMSIFLADELGLDSELTSTLMNNNFIKKVYSKLKQLLREQGLEKVKDTISGMIIALLFWRCVKAVLNITRSNIDFEDISEKPLSRVNHIAELYKKRIKKGGPALDKYDFNESKNPFNDDNINKMADNQSKLQKFLFKFSKLSYKWGFLANKCSSDITNSPDSIEYRQFSKRLSKSFSAFMLNFIRKVIR